MIKDLVKTRCSTTNPETSRPVSGTEAPTDDGDGFQCPSCHWHEGHDPAEWFLDEVKLRLQFAERAFRDAAGLVPPNVGGTPGSASNTDAPRQILGMPVVVDDSLPPGTIELRSANQTKGKPC